MSATRTTRKTAGTNAATRSRVSTSAPAVTGNTPNSDGGTGRPAGSRQRLMTALAGRPAGSTVTDLARITGLGHSTVGKALAAAETDAQVTRIPGGRDGARRGPDIWTLPTTPSDAVAVADKPDSATEPARPTTADTTTPAPRASAATTAGNTTAAVSAADAAAGATGRLRKGQLADLTLAWLRGHPGAHTASAIGKATARSSGAIANALEKMATAGTVTQVADHPRTFTAAPPS